MLSFVLLCLVLVLTVHAMRVYLREHDATGPGGHATIVPPGALRRGAAWAAIDSPPYQRRLMRFARAVAASYGRGSRHALEYTTPAGSAFRFTLNREAGTGWRIYIDSQPGYRGRSDGGHETHRFVDDAGRHFICWDGAIRGVEQAVFVAARWALLTERYITTGQRF